MRPEEGEEEEVLLKWLQGLGPALLEQIYRHWECALLVYRLLGAVAQYTVQRLLLTEGPTHFESVRAWHPLELRPRQNAALLLLKKLQIVQGRSNQVWLNSVFQGSLIVSFRERHRHPVRKERREDVFENVLMALVLGDHRRLSAEIEGLLVEAGLASGGSKRISKEGFQFLLADRHVQLWRLLGQFLAGGSNEEADLLAISRLALFESEPSPLFEALGLLHQGEPTSLISELFQALPQEQGGYIVVETNYKVYAYTRRPLQLAILQLFVRLKGRFADMAYGQLTAASVQAAYERGITASQLAAFLRNHAKEGTGLPPVIEDQLHLWERERQRLKVADGSLYQQFASDEDLLLVVNEATRLSALLYVNYSRRIVAIRSEAHPAIKAFIKAELQ